MSLKENIKKLSSLCAVSGFESDLHSDIIPLFAKVADEVKTDALGNIIAIKKGTKKGKVMIEAHMDEIGLMVTKIDDNGFLYFTNIGGIDARILPATKVKVHGTKTVTGVIGAKPPHLLDKKEADKTIPMDKLFIDIGFSKDKAEKIVSVGDFVTFYPDFTTLGKKCMASKCFDDRACVAILLDILENLKNTKLPFDLYVVCAVQEEVGRRGAICAASSINPDFAIAIDVCHATTFDAKEGTFKAGSGTVITKGPNLHPVLTKNIINVLKENKIKFSVEACGGDTGTDAWVIQTAKEGIPTALFSVPLKYMHTPNEVLNIDDAKATSDGIRKFITSQESAGEALC